MERLWIPFFRKPGRGILLPGYREGWTGQHQPQARNDRVLVQARLAER